MEAATGVEGRFLPRLFSEKPGLQWVWLCLKVPGQSCPHKLCPRATLQPAPTFSVPLAAQPVLGSKEPHHPCEECSAGSGRRGTTSGQGGLTISSLLQVRLRNYDSCITLWVTNSGLKQCLFSDHLWQHSKKILAHHEVPWTIGAWQPLLKY